MTKTSLVIAGVGCSLLACGNPALPAPVAPARVAGEGVTDQKDVPGLHDFDFLYGHWRVHHRRLKERLADNHEWVPFEGTLFAQKLMNGYGNVDDNVLSLPGGTYRAVGLRSFDVATHQWSIWWLDGRTPLGPLDPPVRGGFHDGVGTFYADDTFNGRPIRMRFAWSKITATTCHWEQAFSPDAGTTWETNWLMDFERVD
jgi:hypothetical protein